MDYAAHYKRLIDRAVARGKPEGYSERHHIVPRCLGGGNEAVNIVRLTPEEHYLAHQMLIKIHTGHKELIWAAVQMTGGNKKQRRSNKLYGWLRRRFREHLRIKATGRKHSPETLAKMRAQRLGKKRNPHTPETKAKMSAASKGRKKSPEHCAAISAVKRGKKRKPHSEETKRKQSIAICAVKKLEDKSYYQVVEYRQKQSDNMRRVWANRRVKGG